MPAQLRFDAGVTLVGGGVATLDDFRAAQALAPHVVAADGGANALRAWGFGADAVVGDMDSVAGLDGWASEAAVVALAEQDSTDLEKCLYSVAAPFYLGVGFTGGRLDHTLAALHVLVKHADRRLVLLGEQDVAFACPASWRVSLEAGARVSFFPMAPVQGVASSGLRWPLAGLDFAPARMIGTSNEADAADVSAAFSGSGMIVMVARRWLGAVLESLGVGES